MNNVNILTNWDQVRAALPPAKDAGRKAKRERGASKLYRRALDWVSKENPTEDYEVRCKMAHEVSSLGIAMPRMTRGAKAAAIWQRRLAYERAERS